MTTTETTKKKLSVRDALGDALVELGREMPNLVVVGADTTESIQMAKFGKTFPERFFNVGIAEQNMIGISAGLALSGKKVLCGTYAVFLERAIDQIRNTIAYCKLDVKIVGAHAGTATGPDGGSHQSIEDIAIMRAIPNMKVLAPADYNSAKALIKEALKEDGPVYIRLVRPSAPEIYKPGHETRLGRAEVLREGKKMTIIANGVAVAEALKAAEELWNEKGMSIRVIDCHTIKPLDKETILKAAKETKRILTVEDHNVNGGMGSAVAELLSTLHPTRMAIMGVNDRFGESADTPSSLAMHGITKDEIKRRAYQLYLSR